MKISKKHLAILCASILIVAASAAAAFGAVTHPATDIVAGTFGSNTGGGKFSFSAPNAASDTISVDRGSVTFGNNPRSGGFYDGVTIGIYGPSGNSWASLSAPDVLTVLGGYGRKTGGPGYSQPLMVGSGGKINFIAGEDGVGNKGGKLIIEPGSNRVGNILLNSDTSGYVGIGTDSPTARLEVNGNIIASAPTASNHVATRAYVDAATSNVIAYRTASCSSSVCTATATCPSGTTIQAFRGCSYTCSDNYCTTSYGDCPFYIDQNSRTKMRGVELGDLNNAGGCTLGSTSCSIKAPNTGYSSVGVLASLGILCSK